MKKQIVNIINFIRGVEPRQEMDLVTPVKKQVALLEKYDLPGTFLLQYDALINPVFTDIVKHTTNKSIELGVWLEVMKPLAEDAGLVWRGREGFDWDWHANVGFSVGYSRAERVKIIDTLMERFRQEFGDYPKSVGSWIIDAFSLDYMVSRYGITASCNCKDQWGTDGYTLWGGYYGQAYYPSKHNAYTPAQTVGNQIPVPIFKMLGSDPIYQYDIGLSIDDQAPSWQQVVTLEPVYTGESGGGGEPSWVDWYFRENFNGLCIHFGYTQVGQENSFGWDAMKDGLCYQIELVARLAKENKLEVMTLAESGAWYKENFSTTPATAIAALSDWKDGERQSVWFQSKHYRMNWYMEGNRFWIRDWHVFDEQYVERYEDAVCTEAVLVYDNLPVVDGNRWSGSGIRAGIYPVLPNGDEILFHNVAVTEGEGSIDLRFDTDRGVFRVECFEDTIVVDYFGKAFQLRVVSAHPLPVVNVTEDAIRLAYQGHEYAIGVEQGCAKEDKGVEIEADGDGVIRFRM